MKPFIPQLLCLCLFSALSGCNTPNGEQQAIETLSTNNAELSSTNTISNGNATPIPNASATAQSSANENEANTIPAPADETIFAAAAPLPSIHSARQVAQIENRALSEVSGMVWSRRQNSILWMINDSGNSPDLYAIDSNGKTIGRWSVNAANRDWEDMASISINGESWLLLADVGDNLQNKPESLIHIIKEPTPQTDQNTRLQPIFTLRFRYSEGRHNVEAVASDGESVFLLTKERLSAGQSVPSQLFQLPLSFSGTGQLAVAGKVGTLNPISPSIESSLVASVANVDIHQPTAMDFDRQNRFAYVLNYRGILRYERQANQTWAQAFVGDPVLVSEHSLQQAEALAVDVNGAIWATSEKRPAPIIALPGH